MAWWILRDSGKYWPHKAGYVSTKNPKELCERVEEAQQFRSRRHALAAKWGLCLSGSVSAKKLPEWL